MPLRCLTAIVTVDVVIRCGCEDGCRRDFVRGEAASLGCIGLRGIILSDFLQSTSTIKVSPLALANNYTYIKYKQSDPVSR